MLWKVTLIADGDREMTREEIVELADAIAGWNGIATGIGLLAKYTMVLIGPVLLFVATVLSSDIARHLVAIKPFAAVLLSAGEWLPYFLVSLAFTLIYTLIPNTRVQVRAALVGGVIAGIVWKFTGWGFSVFIASSSKYAAIYSSFAIFILLLIWLYMNCLILLAGSQIFFLCSIRNI